MAAKELAKSMGPIQIKCMTEDNIMLDIFVSAKCASMIHTDIDVI
jgi:hypothetical protein